MTWWKRLVGDADELESIDYYEEGTHLLDQRRYHEALTSFRLALKEAPGDPVVLQQIAIAYSRIGMSDEAAKTYRHVLQKAPDAVGAHYGLAFLLIRAGQGTEAVPHLEAFLHNAPTSPAAQSHVEHAREALAGLVAATGPEAPAASQESSAG